MVSRMQLTRYQSISLITNVLYVYTIYKYLKIFFGRRKTSWYVELVSYIAFYVSLAVIMLYFNRMAINMISTIVLYFLLTLNYKGSMKSRLMATLTIYITIVCAETMSAILFGYLKLDNFYGKNDFSSSTCLVTCRILCFILVMVFENYKHIKEGANIPFSNWMTLFFLPFGSFYIIISIMLLGAERPVMTLICVAVILGINIMTFFLYDAMNNYYEEKLQKIMLQQQNESYLKQMEVMSSSQENVRSVRHDIKNHLVAIESYVKRGENEEAIDYIHKVIDASYGNKAFVSTGNIEIDSILNYKAEQAKARNIEFEKDIKIPTELKIEGLDIVGILGNLIDNAINANMKLEEGRKISLTLKYSKNLFFITVWNPFNGNVLYLDNKIATTHKDKEMHGIGLNNVNSIVQKYDGTMSISHEDKIFKVDIMLYLS